MVDILGLSAPFKAETFGQRLAVVAVGGAILLLSLVAVRRMFSRSFFHGFLVSSGIFLSFDIVVFHWLFRLHRITAGREANVIEPLFVALGLTLIAVGFRQERRSRSDDQTIRGE
jgi:uncharacterized membrane protein